MEYGKFQNPGAQTLPCYRKCIANELNSLYGGYPMYISRPTGSSLPTNTFIGDTFGIFAVFVETLDLVWNSDYNFYDVYGVLLLCCEDGIIDKHKVKIGIKYYYDDTGTWITDEAVLFGSLAYYYEAGASQGDPDMLHVVVCFCCGPYDESGPYMKLVKYTLTKDSTTGQYGTATYSKTNISPNPYDHEISSIEIFGLYKMVNNKPYIWMTDNNTVCIRCGNSDGVVSLTATDLGTNNLYLTDFSISSSNINEQCVASCIDQNGYIQNGVIRINRSNTPWYYYVYNDVANTATVSTSSPYIPASTYASSGTGTSMFATSTRLAANVIGYQSRISASTSDIFIVPSVCSNGCATVSQNVYPQFGRNGFIYRINDHKLAELGLAFQYTPSSIYFGFAAEDPFATGMPVTTIPDGCFPQSYGILLDGNAAEHTYCIWTYSITQKCLVYVPLTSTT